MDRRYYRQILEVKQKKMLKKYFMCEPLSQGLQNFSNDLILNGYILSLIIRFYRRH